MKKAFIYLSILTMVLGITAFECGSAELEGAKLYIRQKQYDKAKEVLLKEVAKNPASDEGWSMLGKLYSEEGDIPKMLEAFDKSLAVSKKFEVDIKEFKKYSWASSFNKGVSYFNSAIATTKQDSINIFFEKAVEQFKYSILCEPDSTIGYENIAAAYLNMGKTNESIPVLEKLISIDNTPALVEGKELIGKSENEIINKLGNPKEKIETTYKDGKIALMLVYQQYFVYLREGRCFEVTKFSSGKSLAWVYSRLGQIHLVNGGKQLDSYKISKNTNDSLKAFEMYNKAISVLENGRYRYPSGTEILLQLANAYYSADKIDVAESFFRDLVEKSPTNKELKYAYGVVLLKVHKYTEAASQLEQVVKMDANNIDACYNLAATYINWGNDLRDEALKKENNDKSYQEKFKLAAPLLEKYLSVKPNDARVWLSLGQVYAHLGMEDKSKAAFKKADENK